MTFSCSWAFLVKSEFRFCHIWAVRFGVSHLHLWVPASSSVETREWVWWCIKALAGGCSEAWSSAHPQPESLGPPSVTWSLCFSSKDAGGQGESRGWLNPRQGEGHWWLMHLERVSQTGFFAWIFSRKQLQNTKQIGWTGAWCVWKSYCSELCCFYFFKIFGDAINQCDNVHQPLWRPSTL